MAIFRAHIVGYDADFGSHRPCFVWFGLVWFCFSFFVPVVFLLRVRTAVFIVAVEGLLKGIFEAFLMESRAVFKDPVMAVFRILRGLKRKYIFFKKKRSFGDLLRVPTFCAIRPLNGPSRFFKKLFF